jgi:hypothetical protein
VLFEIEGTFIFGAFGGFPSCLRNAFQNNVGGNMKGRSVIAGEKWKTKYPALPPPNHGG